MIDTPTKRFKRRMYFAAITVTLVLLGIIFGCAYLVSLRCGKASMSVVELSQCIKTIHLFVVVVCYLLNNRELVEFSTYQTVHIPQCHIKGYYFFSNPPFFVHLKYRTCNILCIRITILFILFTFAEVTNEMLLGTLPATVTVLAIVRLRVCLCKGNATKLVSKRFVVVLYSLEVLGSIFLWALLQTPELFINKDRFIDRIVQNETSENSFISLDACYKHIREIHNSVMFYKWANIILCYILPVIIGICIYGKIILHVYQSATRVQMHAIMPITHPSTSISLIPSTHQPISMSSSTRLSNGYRNAINIHRSILGIVTGIVFSWVPACVVKIVSLISNDYLSNLYRAELLLVFVIFVIFPFEEGLFQTDKRKRIFSLLKRLLGKNSQNSLHEGMRHEVILIPKIENGVNTLLSSLQESDESATEEKGVVKHLSVNSSKASQHSLNSDQCQRTSIKSFDSCSSSSLYSRRRGFMVPSLSLSTNAGSENSSVFIISTPLSVDQHSPYLSSNGSFSPLFIKVNRERLQSQDSRNLSESFNCTPYSIRTFSFGSTLSYDCQESIGSGRKTSVSRARSKWRSFQRKISSSLKYNISDHSIE